MATSEKRTLSIDAKLSDNISAPLKKAEGGLGKFAKTAYGAFKGVLGTIFNLKSAVLGLATSFLSLSAIKSFGEQADALLKLAASTGDTVENLSELQASFELAGVKSEDFATVLKALETQARKARTESTDKLKESFAALGITITDLQTLGPSQLFEKMAAGLEKYATAQQKNIALGKVLPKQFLDLLPVLGKGLDEFQAGILRARANGATVTQQQAKAAEELNDSLTDVQQSLGGLSRALITEFGPDATALFQRIAKEITSNREGIVKFAKAVGGLLVGAFNLATTSVIGLVHLIEQISPVDLIDKERLQQQVGEAKTQLALIKALRDQVAAEGRLSSRELETLRAGGLGRSINTTVNGLPISRSRTEVEELLPKEEEIYFALKNLELQLSGGLAKAMQQVRDRVASELSEAAKSIANPEQAIASFGLPTTSDWDGYAQAFGQAMQKAAASGESFKSVFADGELKASIDAFADEEQWQKLEDEINGVWEAMEKGADKVRVAFSGDFWEGFNQGAHNAVVEITDFGRAGQAAANQLIEGGFNGLSDAFADALIGAKSLKQALKDFARSFLSDLARIITRLIIVRALSNVFGSTTTPSTTPAPTPSPDLSLASIGSSQSLGLGGAPRTKRLQIGASGGIPMPTGAGASSAAASAGGGDTHVYFTVNAIDARSVQQMLIEQGPTIAAVVAERAGSRTKFRQDLAKATR